MRTQRKWISLLLALALLTGCAGALGEQIGDGEMLVLEPEEELVFDDSVDSYLLEQREKVGSMRNLLLVGLDARPGETTGRSDTMIIVTLDPDGGSIKLTSIMRDLYVEIPGKKNNRINAAYVLGGPELLLKTIEANFGVHIDNYIAVNFSMLGTLIDSIGGLTLTVEDSYYMDRINAVIKMDNKVLGIDPEDQFLTQPGEQLMTGKQAQAYARYRYGTSDGDFGRTKRQREVIMKIFDELARRSVVELMTMVVQNAGNVYTNLSVADLAAFAPVLISMKDAQFEEFRLPLDNAYSSKTISGMSVLVPDRKKNVQALMDFLEE